MKSLLYIAIIILGITSCKKIDVSPAGFFEANYITDPNTDQSFTYYYDDGELVADALGNPIVNVTSSAGTFDQESLLLLKFKREIEQLQDSILPYTYFMGIQYDDTIKQDLNLSFNLNYAYNNTVNKNYYEREFMRDNFSQLKLYEIQYEDQASFYYDPNVTVVEKPFVIEGNELKFSTSSKSSLFGFCWVEESWQDTLQFQLSGTDQTNLYQGNRANPTGREGAYLAGNTLFLDYSDSTFADSTIAGGSLWRIRECHLAINNPSESVIDNNDVFSDIIIFRYLGTTKIHTRLSITEDTEIEILNWPDNNQHGRLSITGQVRKEDTQSDVLIDMIINFKRQR
ncbi:MAG: hypothetical protein MK078_03480 [Crocinitomicaceae bacterium]|nr:hypothetical protein [Crocinitomicaceae bacterium]